MTEEAGALVSLDWGWASAQGETPLLLEARRQLHRYFDGETDDFDLPLRPTGTAYEQRVWAEICAIPYGHTQPYSALAGRLGSVARAVGRATGANPLPILIPCHRVVGAKGARTGYSGDGGVETKRALLILEGALAPPLL